MPARRPRPYDVAIVGGGVAGLSLARAAARAGASVALFERAADGPGGASALPAALLNPWRGRKGDAHPDDLAGLATVRRWAAQLAAEGREPAAHLAGLLRIPGSSRQARGWRERAAAEPTLAWIEPERVPPPYYAPFGALRVQDGGWLEPGRWLAALASSARALGAEVRTGVAVARLIGGEAAAWRLDGVDGAPLATATAVVVAVGADAAPAATFGGAELAWPVWTRTRGEVVTLEGGPVFELPVAGGIYGASLGDRAWVGGGHRPAHEDDPDAPANLREAFAWSLPGLASARIAEVWSGARAKRGDARPSIEALAPRLWTFGAFAGRGFLCAASEAERWTARWREDVTGASRDGTDAGVA